MKGRNLYDKTIHFFKDSMFHEIFYFDFLSPNLQTFVQLLIIFTSVVSQGWNDIDSDRQAKKALEEYKKLYRSEYLKSPE